MATPYGISHPCRCNSGVTTRRSPSPASHTIKQRTTTSPYQHHHRHQCRHQQQPRGQRPPHRSCEHHPWCRPHGAHGQRHQQQPHGWQHCTNMGANTRGRRMDSSAYAGRLGGSSAMAPLSDASNDDTGTGYSAVVVFSTTTGTGTQPTQPSNTTSTTTYPHQHGATGLRHSSSNFAAPPPPSSTSRRPKHGR